MQVCVLQILSDSQAVEHISQYSEVTMEVFRYVSCVRNRKCLMVLLSIVIIIQISTLSSPQKYPYKLKSIKEFIEEFCIRLEQELQKISQKNFNIYVTLERTPLLLVCLMKLQCPTDSPRYSVPALLTVRHLYNKPRNCSDKTTSASSALPYWRKTATKLIKGKVKKLTHLSLSTLKSRESMRS